MIRVEVPSSRMRREVFCRDCADEKIMKIMDRGQTNSEVAWDALTTTLGLDAVVGAELPTGRIVSSSEVVYPYCELWSPLEDGWKSGNWIPPEGIQSITMNPWAYPHPIRQEAYDLRSMPVNAFSYHQIHEYNER